MYQPWLLVCILSLATVLSAIDLTRGEAHFGILKFHSAKAFVGLRRIYAKTVAGLREAFDGWHYCKSIFSSTKLLCNNMEP